MGHKVEDACDLVSKEIGVNADTIKNWRYRKPPGYTKTLDDYKSIFSEEIQMTEEHFKKLPKWEQIITLPAERQANGKLILRGGGTSKALHEIKPGKEIAIAVFKNDENYLIAVSFWERDNTFEQAWSYSENNPNFDT